MNILLINTNCSVNKGSAAQVFSTISALEQIYNGANFSLLSQVFEFDEEAARKIPEWTKKKLFVYGYPLRETSHTLINYLFHITRCIFYCILQRYLFLDKIKFKETFTKVYSEADLIVDLSGDTIADHVGIIALFTCLGILPAIVLKKPFVIYSQSIGPFKFRSRWFVRFCFNRAKAILLREEISLNYLLSLNVKNKKIFLKADCAFCLDTAPEKRIKEIMALEGIKRNNKPLVGISLSKLMENLDTNYVPSMAKLIDFIIENLDVEVLFIPHVAHAKSLGADSRDTQNKVFEKVRNKSSVMVINGDYYPQELKGLISTCDLFIGSYMHACIAALSSCVPSLVLGWAHKFKGIMSLVGMDEFVFDYRTATLEQLEAVVIKLWQQKDALRKMLEEKSAQARKSALEAAIIVKQVLGGKDESFKEK